jgi:hypothetical protein
MNWSTSALLIIDLKNVVLKCVLFLCVSSSPQRPIEGIGWTTALTVTLSTRWN